MSERSATDLAAPASRGERQLLHNPLIYLGRGGQPMGLFQIPQRLLGRGPLLSSGLTG